MEQILKDREEGYWELDCDAAADVRRRLLALARFMDRLAGEEDGGRSGEVLDAMREALEGIPGHPWYARRAHVLGPVLRACLAEWFADLKARAGTEDRPPCLEISVASVLEACLDRREETVS